MSDFSQRRVNMVDTQVRPNDVTKFPIIEAMLAIPREVFVPHARREAAYVGENVELVPGRVMFEPRTLAKMLDALDIVPGNRVLVVGAGQGYSAAVIARMGADVVALEEDPALAEAAARVLAAEGEGARLVQGALAAGAAAEGPFEAILVEGGAEHVPAALIAQLKEGGRIACLFLQGALGVVRIGHKIDGAVSWRDAFHAAAPVLPGFEAGREFRL